MKYNTCKRVVQQPASHPALTNFEPADTVAKVGVARPGRWPLSSSRRTQGRGSTISSTSLFGSPFILTVTLTACWTSTVSSRLGESAYTSLSTMRSESSVKEPPPGEEVNVALCRRTNKELSGDSRGVLLCERGLEHAITWGATRLTSSPVSQIREGTYDRGSGVVNRAPRRLALPGDEYKAISTTAELDFRGKGSSTSS